MSKAGRISKKVEKKVKEYFEKLENGNNKDNAKQRSNQSGGDSKRP